MKPAAQIDRLIEFHVGDYVKCPGCDTCKKIQELSKLVNREPAERYKHILDKGWDMTKSDIGLLIKNDVSQSEIRKALDMDPWEFRKMMMDYGFSKKREANKVKKNEINDRLELYKSIKKVDPELSVREVAEKMGMKENTLRWNVRQWKNAGLIEAPSIAKTKETYESMKKKVEKEIKGDPALIKKLQGRISELEQQVKGYPALQKRAAKLEIENMKLEDNYEKNLKKNAEKINELTEKLEDTYIEKDRWEQQARLYARENDLMNDTNKHLREIAEQLRRERNASVELLKVTL